MAIFFVSPHILLLSNNFFIQVIPIGINKQRETRYLVYFKYSSIFKLIDEY